MLCLCTGHVVDTDVYRESTGTHAVGQVRIQHEPDLEDQVMLAYRHCFSREPDEIELRLALEFLNESREDETESEVSSGDDPSGPPAAMIDYCQALLATSEFRNVD